MMSGPMLPKLGFPMATAYTVLTRMNVKMNSQPAACHAMHNSILQELVQAGPEQLQEHGARSRVTGRMTT